MMQTGIDPAQVLNYIIRPVLSRLDAAQRGMASPAAEALLLGTAAQESGFKYLAQVGGGPALGLWQCEPATMLDCFSNFLAYRTALRDAVLSFAFPGMDRSQQLSGNVFFASAVARAQFFRAPEPLPAATDVAGLARYWKKRWNTVSGAGTEAQFIANWSSFGLGAVLAK